MPKMGQFRPKTPEIGLKGLIMTDFVRISYGIFVDGRTDGRTNISPAILR